MTAGSRARLAILGFPNNSTIRVSVAGQPDFTVTTANGAYTWDMFIPLSAKSGAMAVHAADTKGTGAADATLTVRGFNDNRVPADQSAGRQSDRSARCAVAARLTDCVARCRRCPGGGRRGDL